ncbi:MAG: hypothetical protein AB7K71_13445 [Polyangiaceae bacterium]
MRLVFLLGGAASLVRDLQSALGASADVRPLTSAMEAVQLLERDERTVLVVPGDVVLERRRWGAHPRAVIFDGDLSACARRVREIQRLADGRNEPRVAALLLAVTNALCWSLGDDCTVEPCVFPTVLREREIALLSIAGPSEGGVVVVPEGQLAVRLGSSAMSTCAWDREIAATSTLLGLAEEVRTASEGFLLQFGAFDLATPVVISGDGLNVRAGACPQFAYRMDLSSASHDEESAALVVAGWLGTGHGKPTTTAERLAGLDELRQELMVRRGAG